MNDNARRGWQIAAWLLLAVQASAVLLFVMLMLSGLIPLLPNELWTPALRWSIYGAYLTPVTGAVAWWAFRDAAGPRTSPWPRRLAIGITVAAGLMMGFIMLFMIGIAIGGYRE